MRKPDRETAADRAAPLTVELGAWVRLEPDAIDALERLTAAFKADLQRGRTPGPARVRELLAGRGSGAVATAEAGLVAVLDRDGRT